MITDYPWNIRKAQKKKLSVNLKKTFYYKSGPWKPLFNGIERFALGQFTYFVAYRLSNQFINIAHIRMMELRIIVVFRRSQREYPTLNSNIESSTL